jgi:hypothetical protein
MPRIPTNTNAQNTREQVSSPVPIGSSQAARLPGETLANFGEAVAKTAQTVGVFEAQKEAAMTRTSLNNVQVDADRAAEDALRETNKVAKADGSDYAETYDKIYQEKTAPLLENISDDRTKQMAQAVVKERSNARQSRVTQEIDTRQVKYVDTTFQATQSSLIGSTMQNPNAVVQNIQSFEKSLGDTGLVYSEEVKNAKLIQGREQIADGAVTGLIQQNRFKEALNFVQGDGAQYFDAKGLESKIKEINAADVAHRNQKIQDDYRFERDQDKLQKKAQDTQFSGLFSDLITNQDNPARRTEVQLQARKALDDGLIRPEQFNTINRAQRTIEGTGAMAFLKTQALLQNGGSNDMAEDIRKDIDDGRLDPGIGKSQLQLNNRYQEKASNAKFQAEVQPVKKQLDATFKSLYPTTPSDTPTEAQAHFMLDVQNKMLDYVDKGMPVQKASKKALQDLTPKPQELPPIPGINLPQNSTRDLVEVHKALEAARPTTQEQRAQAEQQLKAYIARKKSAEIHEEEIK